MLKWTQKKKLPEMKFELKYYLSKADFFLFFFIITISFSFQFFVNFDNNFTLVFQTFLFPWQISGIARSTCSACLSKISKSCKFSTSLSKEWSGFETGIVSSYWMTCICIWIGEISFWSTWNSWIATSSV